MKSICAFIFIVSLLSVNITPVHGQKLKQKLFKLNPFITDKDYQQGKIIIKLKPELRSLCTRDKVTDASLEKVFSVLKAGTVEKIFPNHHAPEKAINDNKEKLIDLSLIYEVNYSSGAPIEKAINLLMSTGKLIYAEPDYIYKPLYIPNDTGITCQYHLAMIRAYQAWDINQGDSNIVIGFTDTGCDVTHPDLTPRVAFNTADPINGIDDDNDGYVDNYNGWNTAQNNNDVSEPGNPHGTFVIGLACAQNDNTTDGAGVGFNTKFIPIRCSTNGASIINGELGIVYAADHNCIAVNCSWGGFGGSQFGQDAVNYATFNRNCLVVAAAGNNNNEVPFFPASYQHVLSVCGSNQTDNKWIGSSYGSLCDISTPGDNLCSILAGDPNVMPYSGGTSEAAPQAIGGAALVKKQFPSLNAMQIGEQLRATSDDIDTVAGNAQYFHKLGKGRMNLFRALSDTTAKSLRAFDISISDNNDDVFVLNDTLRISAVFTNYLAALSNLNITLTTSSPYITFINAAFNPGAMNSMQADSNRSNPFTVIVTGTPPANTRVYFTFNYSDGSYNDWQMIDLLVNVDYINIFINEVGTSMTSMGRLGFNDSGQSEGLGFIYRAPPTLLYGGGLVIGVNDSVTSDITIGNPPTTMNNDFVPVNRAQQIPSVVSDFDAVATFNDDSAAYPMGILVTHRAYAWMNPADSKYIFYDYVIRNTSVNNYAAIFVGLYADWDMTPINYGTNIAGYDAPRKLGWAHDTQPGGVFCGLKVLTPGGVNYYAFNNDGSNGSVNVYDGFTKLEKYQTMSAWSRMNTDTTDISMMLSNGPFTLNTGDSVHVAFALLASDSLSQLQLAADSAQAKFDYINTFVIENPPYAPEFSCYPNPFNDYCTIKISVGQREIIELTVYDVLGEKVISLWNGYAPPGTHTFHVFSSQLRKGIYFCEIKRAERRTVKKLVVQ
ncbi:MAG: S8 family serine peptidase [Bacteroidia bacterium]|nr:S8 family serine peptidase [Bacteroidia bacterium]